MGELKQENMYLERKVEHLNNQMQAKVDYEDYYKNRLKSVREELQQVKEKTESEVTELKKKLLDADMKLTEAKSEADSKAREERIMRRRYESLEKRVKDEANLSEQRISDLQVRKSVLITMTTENRDITDSQIHIQAIIK